MFQYFRFLHATNDQLSVLLGRRRSAPSARRRSQSGIFWSLSEIRRRFSRLGLIGAVCAWTFGGLPAASAATTTVTILPGEDIPSTVTASPAGTTFLIYPGTYRVTQPIVPKNGDSFIGQTPCAPPTTSCPAIITGSVVIGPSAVFDGKNYEVSGQTQQGPQGDAAWCIAGFTGCRLPEDLFFDGVPLQHLDSPTLPVIRAGQWWFDYTNHIIYFHDNPAGHTVETSVVNNAFGGPANNVTIQYLTVKEFANMQSVSAIGQQQGASAQTTETGWTVENCEVTLNHWNGIQVNYLMQILNNYVHINGDEGIGGGFTTAAAAQGNSQILVQGNTIASNNYARVLPGHGAGGFKVGSVTGLTLRGNTIINNLGECIHFDVNSGANFVDGNTCENNTDQSALINEISFGPTIFRNNILLENGRSTVTSGGGFHELVSQASSGVEAYCNTTDVPASSSGAWSIGAADRGDSGYPPFQYLASTGNYFHHNTVIWDLGASGNLGLFQHDTLNQPDFFSSNTPPDYNTYHAPSTSTPAFVYDDNDTGLNGLKTFAEYQAAGADVNGSIDSNYNVGFPGVFIISPADQSSFTNSVAVRAAASDKSGIAKVEFYVDWNLEQTLVGPPYNFVLQEQSAGTHTVAAMAYSNAGVRACYAITLNQQ